MVKEKVKEITPFEVIRNEHLYYELEENYKWTKDIEKAEQYTRLETTIIKPNSIINLTTLYKVRRYNEKSKGNLVQYQNERIDELKEISNINEIEDFGDINNWAKEYEQKHLEIKKKAVKRILSKQTKEKVYKASSVFVRSILSGFVSSLGFRQRTITFATFTITESQKHSDKEIIKTFVDFIDHLKKVNNYLINPLTKERTKEKGLVIDNYVWRAETQENGNVHFHLLSDVFLNQDMLRRTWNGYLEKLGYKYGYGAANVNSIQRDKKNNKIKNVEKYLCKYMTKPPLKTKYKYHTKKQLMLIDDTEKYRRAIVGKTWGCSRKLLGLEYPKFYGNKAKEVLRKMRDKLKEYRNINIPEYIKIYTGDVRKELKNQSYEIQKDIKNHYLLCLHWLYGEVPLHEIKI